MGAAPETYWNPMFHPLTPSQMGDFTPGQLMALRRAIGGN